MILTRTDYFESDISRHRWVVMAPQALPDADGTTSWGMYLLVQGDRRDVAHQVSGRSESFRVLLCKRALIEGPILEAPPPMAERFTLEPGGFVALVPCAGGLSSPFMQTVALLAATRDPVEAKRRARAAGCVALLAEVVEVVETGLGPTDLVRWDRGRVELPPREPGRGPPANCRRAGSDRVRRASRAARLRQVEPRRAPSRIGCRDDTHVLPSPMMDVGNERKDGLREPPSWPALIWEFYIPKKACYLTALYRFLDQAVSQAPATEPAPGAPEVRLEGYSIYEVDGAYRGAERTYEERVLVVRVVFPRTATLPKLRVMGHHLLKITGFEEEQVWIIQYGGCRVHSVTR